MRERFARTLAYLERFKDLLATRAAFRRYQQDGYVAIAILYARRDQYLPSPNMDIKPAEKQAIRDHFEAAGSWARKHDRPVCLSEFGANSKADLASRVRWTRFVADTALSQSFSFTYWDFCAEYFGLYDPGTKSWRRQLLEAVLPPHVRSSGSK